MIPNKHTKGEATYVVYYLKKLHLKNSYYELCTTLTSFLKNMYYYNRHKSRHPIKFIYILPEFRYLQKQKQGIYLNKEIFRTLFRE